MKITFTQYDLACMMRLEKDCSYKYDPHNPTEQRFTFHGVTLVEHEDYYDDGNNNVSTRVGARVMEMVGKAAAKLMVGEDK